MCKSKMAEVICIYCHAKDNFGTRLPNIHYVNHLVSEHKIMYDVDNVVQRTITLHKLGIVVSDGDEELEEEQVASNEENGIEAASIQDEKNEKKKDERRSSKRTQITVKKEVVNDDKEEVAAKKPLAKKRSHSQDVTSQILPWFAGCEYRCQVKGCGQMFYYNQDLRTHVRKEHCSADDYLDRYKQFETKAVFVKCRECKQDVKRHYASVLGHLEKEHNGMTLDRYQKKHRLVDYEVTYHEPNREDNDSKRSKVQQQTSPVIKPSIIKQEVVSPPEGNNDAKFRKWVSQCRMTCKVCQETYENYVWYGKHLKADHGLTIKEYNAQYGTIYEEKVVHKCLLCKQTVLQEQSHLFNHVWRQHNMSVKTYYRKHYSPSNVMCNDGKQDGKPYTDTLDQCEYTCKMCSFSTKNRSDFSKNHLEAKHGISPSEYIKKYGPLETTVLYHKCLKCRRTIKWDTVITERHVLKAHKMSLEQYLDKYKPQHDLLTIPVPELEQHLKWADKCTYCCKMCKRSMQIRNSFIKHLLRTHNLSLKSYCAKFGNDIESKVVYHSCQVCGEKVKHDRSKIATHCGSKHKLSMSRYYHKYIKAKEEDVGQKANKMEKATVVAKRKRNGSFYEHTKWANQCTYKCALCNHVTHSRDAFSKHILSAHNIGTEAYSAKFEFESKLVYHTCKLCGKKTKHDSCLIHRHTVATHSLTLLEYYQMYIKDEPKEDVDGAEMEDEEYIDVVEIEEDTAGGKVEQGRITLEHIKWANQCTYKCNLCDYVTKSRASFTKCHLPQQHNLGFKKYCAKFDGGIESDVVYHNCKVCGESVKHDNHILRCHFQNADHNMSAKEYYDKYINVSSTMHVVRTDVVEKDEEDTAGGKVEQRRTTLEHNTWADQCTYKCNLCDYVTKKRASFIAVHLPQQHNLGFKKYCAKFDGRVESDVVYHNCKVCGGSVKHDSSLLVHHISNRKHNLTLKEYYDKYIKVSSTTNKRNSMTVHTTWANQCTYTCKLCNYTTQNRNTFVKLHLNVKHKQTFMEYCKQFGPDVESKVVLHQCKLCGKKFKHDDRVFSAHLYKGHNINLSTYYTNYIQGETNKDAGEKTDKHPKEQQSSDPELDTWKNACTYSCQLCTYVAVYRAKFIQHIKTKHKMKPQRYMVKFGSLETTAKFHQCALCSTRLKQDSTVLTLHLIRKHGTNISDYYERHVRTKAKKGQYKFNFNTNLTSKIAPKDFNMYQQWKNSCEYQCRMCTFFATTRARMKMHLKDKHKLSTKDYVKQFGALETKAVYHQCKLCKKPMLQDFQLLDVHFRVIHNQNLQYYYLTSILGKPPDDDSEESRPPKKKAKVIRKAAADDEEQGIEFEVWKNQCEYGCRKCAFITQSRLEFVRHIKGMHKLQYQAYYSQYGSLKTNTQHHVCKVCSKQFGHDEFIMNLHMRRQHQMSLRDYFSKYIANDLSKGPVVPMQDIPIVSCSNALEDPVASKPPQSVAEWMNQCTYQCRKCNAKLESDEALSMHVAYHGIDSMEEFVATYGQPLKITSLFHCAVCVSLMKHDFEIIAQHLEDQHGMSPEEYFGQYVNPQAALNENNLIISGDPLDSGIPVGFEILGSVATEIDASAEAIATETATSAVDFATETAASAVDFATETAAGSNSTELAKDNSAATNDQQNELGLQVHNVISTNDSTFDQELHLVLSDDESDSTHPSQTVAIKQEIEDNDDQNLMDIQDELDNLVD